MGVKCADVKGCFSRLTGVCKRTIRCFEAGVLYRYTSNQYILDIWERRCLKWFCFLGQVCGLSKMHLVCVHAAFCVSAWPKYAMSGVCLSRAV